MSGRLEAEEKAMIVDVIAAPDDDVPRLIFADWCEDCGRYDRAEVIRLQCQIESSSARSSAGCSMLPDTTCSGANAATRAMGLCKRDGGGEVWCSVCLPKVLLLERERELLAGKPLWADVPPWVEECNWRRGFVERIRTTMVVWFEHSREAVVTWPLRRVDLSDRIPVIMAGDWHYWFVLKSDRLTDGAFERHNFLPARLAELLGGNYPSCGQVRVFSTTEACREALSRALIELAKRKPLLSGQKATVTVGGVTMPVTNWSVGG